MKVLNTIKNFFVGLLGIVFFVFALSMTILLLSYNDFGLSQFGNKTLVLMNNQIYSETYKKGDLIIVENRGFTKGLGYADKIEVGDELFAVRLDAYGNVSIEIGKVAELYIDENAVSFENGSTFDLKFILGEQVQVYENVATFLSIVESKWGFLFIVLVPSFLIFIYEVYSLIVEIKYGKDEE